VTVKFRAPWPKPPKKAALAVVGLTVTVGRESESLEIRLHEGGADVSAKVGGHMGEAGTSYRALSARVVQALVAAGLLAEDLACP